MMLYLKNTGLLLLVLLQLAISPAFADDKPVWPEPPGAARIRYVSTIHSSKDLGIKKKFWTKVLDFALGRDASRESLVKPLSVFVDTRDKIYVTDQGLRVLHVFDQTKKNYLRVDHAGMTNFISPVDVTVAKNGTIFLSDSELKTVFILNQRGKLKNSIEGYFSRPTGLCIYQNRLYVADTGYHKIFVFTLDGTYLYEFGQQGVEPGEFNYPVFLSAGEYLYVNDAMNFRLQMIDGKHKNMGTFGQQGDVQGTFMRSKGVAVDSQNNIYVVDNLFNVFQIFNAHGKLLLVVGSQGWGAGQFNMPSGIWIDHNDKVYVADTMNARIQIFQFLKSGDNE